MGWPRATSLSRGGLVLHRRQSCPVAPIVTQPHHLLATTMGSAITWGGSGHSQAPGTRGLGPWPGIAGRIATAPGLGGGPIMGLEQHKKGQQCCHHGGD